jgi:prepilin-type N-terminal cleavage/methylation domain-containing protein
MDRIMKNPTLLLQLIHHLNRKKLRIKESVPQGNAGFTLVELLVVVILVGVIAAIAGPSWQGFISQRRVNSANEVVLRALQEAQSQAKTTKQNYSVTIRTSTDKIPQIAVHRAASVPDDNSPLWRSLGKDLALNNRQIWIGTNATRGNEASGTISHPDENKKEGTTVATFDLLGSLATDPKPNLGNKGLIIAVAQPQLNDLTQRLDGTTRCVKITTLLGSIEIGRKLDECKPD